MASRPPSQITAGAARLTCLMMAVAFVSMTSAQQPSTRPPATKIDPVIDTLHRVTVADNYRWLEGDNSDPAEMGKVTPEVAAWTDAQNAYTRSVLDARPGRKAVEERLRPLMEVGSITAPHMRADRYFFSKREGTQNQPV